MKRIFLAALLLSIFPVTAALAKESGPDIKVKMTAGVLSVCDRLCVEVLESEYTSGVHVVITPADTVYLDGHGNEISRDEIKVGDLVEIFYNGQVMLSYPPQIVARKIIRL